MQLINSFRNYAGLAFAKDAKAYTKVANYDKNAAERIGDALLYPTYELPHKMWSLAKNPQFLALMFTVGALTVNSFVFYPSKTYQAFRAAARQIRAIVGPHMRIASYTVISSQIIALGIFRTMLGRFANKTLMNKMAENA